MIEYIANKEVNVFSINRLNKFVNKGFLTLQEAKIIRARKDRKGKHYFTLNDKIKITVRKLTPSVNLNGLRKEHELRDKVLHSGPTSHTYQKLHETNFVNEVSYLLLTAKVRQIASMNLPGFEDKERSSLKQKHMHRKLTSKN